MAVPGYPGLSSKDDLIAVWKTTNGQRFQNYKALSTILDVPVIKRPWIKSLAYKNNHCSSPDKFKIWKEKGKYFPLISENTTTIRTQQDQMPKQSIEWNILERIYKYFCINPFAFEACAARIFQLQDERAIIDNITRSNADGGRDAVGRYVLGIT